MYVTAGANIMLPRHEELIIVEWASFYLTERIKAEIVDITQLVECLLSKQEVLYFVLRTT